jgi:hypothetical protein
VSARAVTLPNGRRVGLGTYVAAWKRLKVIAAEEPGALMPGWDAFPTPAADILAAMRRGMHERISAGIPYSARGR